MYGLNNSLDMKTRNTEGIVKTLYKNIIPIHNWEEVL
jgi:hypothetical protein